jgi:hypothetical protein
MKRNERDVRQLVYSLTIEEASEAFAEYVTKRTGEKFGAVSHISIGVDPEGGVVVWTITPVDSREKHEEISPILPPGSGLLN